MRQTLKVLSALLSYPTTELKAATGELRSALDSEGALPQRCRDRLDRIIEEIASGDLYDLQERYVLLFDRTRSLSLHLFEHVHGESRARGQAMVDLAALYQRHGYRVAASELPDYLPLLLEFLAVAPEAVARELIADTAHILELIRQRLKKRKSAYSSVLSSVLALAGEAGEAETAAMVAHEPDDDPNDLAALDRRWMDEEVRFGPTATDCGKDELGTRLRAGSRPAPDMAAQPRRRPVVTVNGSPRR